MQMQLRPTRRKIRPSLPSYFLRCICVHRSEAASRSPETPRPHFTDHTPASESAKVDCCKLVPLLASGPNIV